MSLPISYQSVQLSAWLLALIEFVLGLYLVAINARHSANRHTSILLLLIAANTFAIGWILSATTPAQAMQPAILLTISTPAIQPIALVATLALLKPEWLYGRGRVTVWLFYLLALFPVVMILTDLRLGTNYWSGGLLSLQNAAGAFGVNSTITGQYASIVHLVAYTILPALIILCTLYLALVDKSTLPHNRRLAWLLLLAALINFVLLSPIASLLLPAVPTLLSNSVIALAYGYAAFQQMNSEHRAQRGSLQARLMTLSLIVTLPVLLAISAFLIQQAGSLLEQFHTNTELMIFQRNALIVLAVGVVILLFLSWFTIRQAVQPIRDLKETAGNIASGDLTHAAMIQTDDEIGSLARAFNNITTQLRESIANLERRTADRTRDLERRAYQFQVAAEVASQAAAIHDLAQLLDQTVRLVSERFNYYHVGIFLTDAKGKYVVLRAASSEGGQRLLARNHKLGVGQKGIVGYVAGKGKPRIALDVDTDAVYFNNPDLQKTRSEMALPLNVRDKTIGVLDIQSSKASAFTAEDIEVLQVLADQVALAIDNTRTHAEMEATILELNALYHRRTNQWWQRQLDSGDTTYSYQSYRTIGEGVPGTTDSNQEIEGHLLKLPLALRGQKLGEITLRRHKDSPPWSNEEIELSEQIVRQIALSLDNARLLEENRHRAQSEALVSLITGKTQGLLDVDAVMKTAAQEIGRSLGLGRLQITLSNGRTDASKSNQADQYLSPDRDSDIND